MRALGMVIASLGGSAVVYVGVTLLSDILIPPTGPGESRPLLLIGIAGALCAAFGLSLAGRSR